MKRIYLLGSFNMDLTIRAPYQPEAGETLKGGDFMITPGGKGANQAYACANLGGDVVMSGCVGKDEFGDRLLTGLKSVGADVSRVRRADRTTGVAVILLTGGENRIILDRGANALLSEEDVERALLLCGEGDIWLTQLENPLPVVGYGLRRAKERGLFTILNPAPADAAVLPFLRYVDLLTPNEGERALLGGTKALFSAGVGAVVTTLGGSGYEIACGADAVQYPCIDVPVLDTTGAGDTFCGALAAELARGASLADAARLASKAASIACTRKGAAASIPTREETLAY